MSRVFLYDVDWRLAPFWLPLGVNPRHDGVTITDDGRLVAKYGFIRVETPLANVAGAHITRGYRWWTAAGARRSFVDDGFTLGTNAKAGVCVHFRSNVPSPLKRSGHSALTVTVLDLDGLVAALGS